MQHGENGCNVVRTHATSRDQMRNRQNKRQDTGQTHMPDTQARTKDWEARGKEQDRDEEGEDLVEVSDVAAVQEHVGLVHDHQTHL
eukprot:624642-Rhodomonas_salina.1